MRLLSKLEDLDGKKILLRADFDVPLENGEIADDTRIEAALPSINFLLRKKAFLVLISHLGRPQGREPKFSLQPVKKRLEDLLGEKVLFLEDFQKQPPGKITLLENLRFWEEEKAGDEQFAKRLAEMGEIYVNDAFADSHRSHASIVGIPKFLPSYAGLNLEKEIEQLTKILQNPSRPLVAIIGGAKLETKLPAIENLAGIADKVLVGGKLMFEVDKKTLPKNVVVASDDIDTKDIGKESVKIFKENIERAKEIIWNGPVGLFEEEKYANGTKQVAHAVVESDAYVVIGGGDTIAAVDEFKLREKIDFVSTGGGAMLEFISGKKLPGLDALN